MQPALQPTLYELLEALPERLTGEILNGQLEAHPRPSIRHINVGSALGGKLHDPFQNGNGGPGGWWIFIEPEVHFIRNVEVAVPDLAGLRRERMPYLPEDHRLGIAPDWICEILSPSTASSDREVKMPLYAHYGVQYVWLIDPIGHTLEAYRLDAGAWVEIGRFADADQISIPPFEAISFGLEVLWGFRKPTIVRRNNPVS